MQEGPELLDFGVDEVAEQLTLMDAVRTREGRRMWGGGQIPLNTDPTHPPPPSPLLSGALLASAAMRVPGLHVVPAGPARGCRHLPHCARHCDPVQHSDRLCAGLGARGVRPGCPTEGAATGEVDPHRPGACYRGHAGERHRGRTEVGREEGGDGRQRTGVWDCGEGWKVPREKLRRGLCRAVFPSRAARLRAAEGRRVSVTTRSTEAWRVEFSAFPTGGACHGSLLWSSFPSHLSGRLLAI